MSASTSDSYVKPYPGLSSRETAHLQQRSSIKRCGKCNKCEHINAAKSLYAPNPPFSHANDATVEGWNRQLYNYPCVLQQDVPVPMDVPNWARYHDGGYEVSSQGDQRFSALFARLSDGRMIEEAYQLDVKGWRPVHTDWRKAKGLAPVRNITPAQAYAEYKALWAQWLAENPEPAAELSGIVASGVPLTDRFASSEINQARALAELLNDAATKQ